MTTIDQINVSYSQCKEKAIQNLVSKYHYSEIKNSFYTVAHYFYLKGEYFFNREELDSEISSVMAAEKQKKFASDFERLRKVQLLVEEPLEKLRLEYRNHQN